MSTNDNVKTSSKYLAAVFMAIFVEGITSYIKNVSIDGSFTIGMALSLLAGLIIAVCYDIDIPREFGIVSKICFVGNIISGFIIARGSNYIYDFISKFM